jgi:hypothetical protein
MVVLKLNVTGKKQNKTNKCGNKDMFSPLVFFV